MDPETQEWHRRRKREYKALKQYLHNDVGLNALVVRDILKELIDFEVKRLTDNNQLIYLVNDAVNNHFTRRRNQLKNLIEQAVVVAVEQLVAEQLKVFVELRKNIPDDPPAERSRTVDLTPSG